MAASATSLEYVQKMFIAYFGRPVAPTGQEYYGQLVDAGNVAALQDDFWNSAESQSLFGQATTEGKVNAIFNQLFGRDAAVAGLTYWTTEINAGRVSLPAAALTILNSAAAADLDVFNAKLAVAEAFTAELDTTAEILAFQSNTDGARELLAGVTTQAEADAVIANIVAEVAEVVAGGETNPGQTFTLTTGTDNLAGTSGNDTFTAGEAAGAATLTVGDQINGGAGNDTLNWIQTAAVAGVPTGFTLTSVETVNVTSGGAITLNTTAGFADTTALNTNTSGAAQTITAAATHNLVATAALQAGNNTAFNGGNNVTVNATGVTTGTTTVGATTAAAGDVAVNVTNSTGGTTTGAIAVTGGKTVTVTSKAANAVNTTVVQSAVTVTGNASTTAVTVNQDATATAAATVVGKTAGAVTINDVNAASGTAAGTIATVTLNSYDNSTIDSSALTTVNLSGTGGTLGIGRGALTATPTANTLNLNVNGLTAGAITDTEAAADDGFTTINLASTGTASTIADLVAADATALNISGDAKVTLTAQTMAGVKTITVTNTGGASLGTALANDVLFVGGAGADAISIGATTKAINMGAGDDVVTLSSATLGSGGTLNGGDGKDTLVANTNGSSFIADPAFGGFEVLRVAGVAAQGAHNANGFTELEIGATAGASSFTNVAANVGLTVLAGPTGGTTVTLANATGTADSFNLTLKSNANLTAGSVTLAGVETVNITNTDSLTTTASGINTNTLTLVATAAKSVVVTGNAGLNLTNTGNDAITSFDASGVTGAAADAAALAVTFDSVNTTVGENVTIKGGSGNDVLTGSATANDTIYGNDGADTLTYDGGTDTFHGGAGADNFVVGALGTKTSYLTVADAAKADTIVFANAVSVGTVANAALGAKVTLGAAATLDQYLDAAAAGDGSTNALVKWFQFGTDTYVVLDNTAGATFAATDAVVKLVGTIDLSTSAITTVATNDVLTLA